MLTRSDNGGCDMKKRVVITGLGCVTPIGNDVKTTWQNIVNGVSGIRPLTRRNPDLYPAKVAAEVKDFDMTAYVDPKAARRMDRFVQYALASSIQAVEDAGLKVGENVLPQRLGVWIGNGVGGLETYEEQQRILEAKGYKRVSPFTVPMFIPNMAAGQVSIHFGAKAVTACTVTACASGASSIGEAYRVIQRGEADVMITGGTEAPITDMGIASFSSMTALSTNPDPATACRPFDKDRDGFVMGEGAGILILESLEHALNRNARIYAEIVGFASTSDAHHITSPNPDGEEWVRVMKMALDEAQLPPASVSYINAHGTSTVYNDLYETRAIKRLFGEHAYRLAVSSTKSLTGHLLGAAGGVEALISVLAVHHDVLPPTLGLEHPDEDMDLDFVQGRSRSSHVDVALSNSFGFGGHNVSLLFQKYRP